MTTKAAANILASLQGRRPAGPEWFEWALSQAPESMSVPANGANIDVRSWGGSDKPGLLLLHGFVAHADWWSFIAPFLAGDFHVVAFSWSGMGMSDWRQRYTLEDYIDEIDTVAQATGLFGRACKPLVAAHSFASFPALAYGASRGGKLRGIVSMDTPILTPAERKARGRPGREDGQARANRTYPSVEHALARFRLSPAQPCENLYIADYIARKGLRPVEKPESGYIWSFDPLLWSGLDRGDPVAHMRAALCPLAFVRGARSALMDAEVRERMRERIPAGVPVIDIPEAHHHLMIDQPLALVAALRGLLSCWPAGSS